MNLTHRFHRSADISNSETRDPLAGSLLKITEAWVVWVVWPERNGRS